MLSPNEQIKAFEKWYKFQWLKVSVRYALSDGIKHIFRKSY